MAELSNNCLKWDNHHGALVSLLDGLLQRERLVDVTLAAEGQLINVHQLVLFASSKYFEDLLCQPHKPAVVFLKDVKFSDLKSLVHYMYHGEVNLPVDQLDNFLQTAKSLQIRGLPYESQHQPSQVEYCKPVLQEQSQNPEMGGPIIDPDSVVSLREPEIQTDQDTSMIQIDEEHFPFKQEGTVGLADLLEQQDQNLLESTADEVDPDLEVLSHEGEQIPAPIVFQQNHEEMIKRENLEADNQQESENNDKENQEEDFDAISGSSSEDEWDPNQILPSERRRTKSTMEKNVVNREHPEAVSGRFKCDNCGGAYSRKGDLTQHKKYGTCHRLKLFPCKLCSTPGYSDPNDLRKHLVHCHKIHPSEVAPYGIKPTFPCDLCSYRALSLATFNKHMRITHKSK